ncbi:MAG: hypothetical protein R2854_23640 [Caldilineaceae bacterium]
MFGIFAAITWWCRRGQHAPARPVQMDGTARLLDPEFNLADALQSFGSELVWRRISPARLQREVTRLYRDPAASSAAPRRWASSNSCAG